MAVLSTRRGTLTSSLIVDGSSDVFLADAFPTARALVIYLIASIVTGQVDIEQSIDGATWVPVGTTISATSEEYQTITLPVGQYRVTTSGTFDGDVLVRYEVKG
jgi:hypothetical protein